MSDMIFTAWTNGGKGFGFKISEKDRDSFFSKDEPSVNIVLPNKDSFIEVTCNTNKASFWNKTCRELIDSKIGSWLKENNHFPWASGNPPKFKVKKVNTNTYKIIEKED